MRAPRYPLELPIRYRRRGGDAWSRGTTANISESGVLFHGADAVAVDAEIEIRIALSGSMSPVGSASLAAADLVCNGRVVRTQAGGAEAITVAAAFSDHRLEQLKNG